MHKRNKLLCVGFDYVARKVTLPLTYIRTDEFAAKTIYPLRLQKKRGDRATYYIWGQI